MNDFGEIHALADAQLEGDERTAAQERLQRCTRSQAEFETIMALKRTLRRCPEADAPEAWQACRARLDELDRVRRTESFVGRYAWAICCLFFVAILGAAVFNRQFGGSTIYASDVPRMLSSVAPISARGANGGDDLRAAIRFSSLQVPEALATGEQLVGVGRGIHQGRQLAAFVYRSAVAAATVYVCPTSCALEGGTPVGERFQAIALEGANCITWSQDERRFFLVGSGDVPALCRIAEAFSRDVR